MAAKPRKQSVTTVRIRVLISFNGMYAGDEADVTMDTRVQGWVNANMVKVLSTSVMLPKEQVMSGGESEAGPGGAEPGDPGGSEDRTAGSRKAGSQPRARSRAS